MAPPPQPDAGPLQTARGTALFTTSVWGLLCLASAAIALSAQSTGANLERLLGLPFRVTPAMILGIIVVGGLLILVLNWWLSVTAVAFAHGYFHRLSKQSTHWALHNGQRTPPG